MALQDVGRQRILHEALERECEERAPKVIIHELKI
jgi:hypothetical protein